MVPKDSIIIFFSHNVHILKLPDFVKLKTAIIMFKAYRHILPMNVQHYSEYTNRCILPGINVSSNESMHVLT